jgi:hypothetical protein
MRALTLLVLLVLSAVSVQALTRLVQPDGTFAALGEEAAPGSITYLFPPQAVEVRSWVLLPPGTVVSEATMTALGSRSVVDFPLVAAPGLRFALEVPAHLLSLTVKGRFGANRTLTRTVNAPGAPGEAWVTRAPGELTVDLPPWKAAPGYTAVLALVRSSAGPWRAVFSDAHRSRAFSFQGSVTRWSFAPAAWGFVPLKLEVTGDDAGLSDVYVRAVGPEAGLPADPKTVLAWPVEAWRSPRREWFSWIGTSVVVLVTADYRVQDDYLKRLAFYIEKSGYRGRLMTDADMAAQHGWNAHDYAAPDLARFYTQAARENFTLNPSELELRARLTAAGVLVDRGGGLWEPGVGALVGISAASPPALRAVLLTHEGFHGLYFTSEAFRAGVKTAWNSLSEGAKAAFRSFLALSQYDPDDEALMVNEFQAYLLQRSAADWAPFLRERVLGRVAGGEALTWLAEYLEAARSLDALVHSLYGLHSGTISTVTP